MNVKFQKLPKSIQDLAQTNNGLKQALNRLELGSKPTPRSWFYETKSPDWILGTITTKLNGMKDLEVISDWDLSKSDKFKPQGGSAPLKDRLDTLDEYFNHLASPVIVKDPLWKKAKLKAIHELRFNGSGSPISSDEVVRLGISGDKYNTSSGYPLYIKRKNPDAIKQALEAEPHCISDRYPFTLGTRASMGKTGTEARHIFMAPMAVNIHGQRYLYPLQEFIRSLNVDFFLPWEGWDKTQRAISSKWVTGSLKFGTDYSKMDQHFNKYHALEVYDVIKHYFRKEYWDDLRASILYVFDAPVITNLGLIDQEHAMPSGSEWTNFLETLWDFILTQYLELKYHIQFIMRAGIGDDQLWILAGNWNAKAQKWILQTVVDVFEKGGTPGNMDKQEVSLSETTFLQRLLWQEWAGPKSDVPAAGVYSLVRNVTSQVYPEFYHNDKKWDHNMFAIRCIMIAENCCYHPLFKWYVTEFLAKANDNILDFVKQKDSQINEQWRVSKTIANFVPTYNQEKQDRPLTEFETFKLLRTMIH